MTALEAGDVDFLIDVEGLGKHRHIVSREEIECLIIQHLVSRGVRMGDCSFLVWLARGDEGPRLLVVNHAEANA